MSVLFAIFYFRLTWNLQICPWLIEIERTVADKFYLLIHAGCCGKWFGHDKGVCSSAEDVGATRAFETNTEKKIPQQTVNKPHNLLWVNSINIFRVILSLFILIIHSDLLDKLKFCLAQPMTVTRCDIFFCVISVSVIYRGIVEGADHLRS